MVWCTDISKFEVKYSDSSHDISRTRLMKILPMKMCPIPISLKTLNAFFVFNLSKNFSIQQRTDYLNYIVLFLILVYVLVLSDAGCSIHVFIDMWNFLFHLGRLRCFVFNRLIDWTFWIACNIGYGNNNFLTCQTTCIWA